MTSGMILVVVSSELRVEVSGTNSSNFKIVVWPAVDPESQDIYNQTVLGMKPEFPGILPKGGRSAAVTFIFPPLW